MPTHEITKADARVSPRALLLLLLVGGLFFAAINDARAASITPFGFLPDAGDAYFVPGDTVFVVEQLDSLWPNSEFGFFYESSPATLVAIFDSLDGCCGQAAAIDFLAAEILDIDTPAATPFTVLPGNIGFYLTIGGALTLYSDPALNTSLGGTDLFFAFESMDNPLQWALYFQADLNGSGPPLDDISLSIVFPLSTISAVPLPPTVYLMGSLLPILMFISRRRRKNAIT
jgi:hypothetical protein